jgi:predicted transposase YdaD
MGVNRYESVALALAASDAYENADENLEVIETAIGDMRTQVALDEDSFAELVSRFRLVLDTNRTAPAVMRIMVSAEAARTAAYEAEDPSHGWLSRRHWRREAERTSRELVSQVAATLDALIDEPY